uniref:Sushi domain-containing protein n=1 Tax=Globodera pallida TaxID=36090 RepID=A0A183BX98_GLOPA
MSIIVLQLSAQHLMILRIPEPCFIGEKDVDFAAGNVPKRLKCKSGEEGGPSNRSVNSGFWSQPEVVKANYNVTKWDCADDNDLRYGMSANIADIDMVCDEPRFIGEKDVDLSNINYTGVFPTAHEYKLAGLDPPTTTTTEEPRPTTTTGKGAELSSTMTSTKNRVDSAFINLLLVVLTFVMTILRHFYALRDCAG